MKSTLKEIGQLIDKNAKLVNALIGSLGIILIIVAILLKTDNPYGQVCISVGTSLVASTIVVYISTKYIYQQSKIKKVVEEWGLTGIFNTRQEMNEFTNMNLENNDYSLDIIAFGLKGFRQAKRDLVVEKIKQGMKLRIITIDPESEYLTERDRVEESKEGNIKTSINVLIEWVESLNEYTSEHNKAELKIYNSLPLDFYFKLDSALYIGPYMYGLDSQQTISYEFKVNSRGYDYYSRYFERLWNNNDFVRSVVN